MTVTVDYIQQWDRRVTGVASTGQHCLVFKHTRLIQEALECESLKSQDRARTEPECWRGRKVKKKRKKHRNVQQQKTMTTCFENKKKIFFMEYIICIYIPSVQTSRPEGLFRSGGRRGDTVGH